MVKEAEQCPTKKGGQRPPLNLNFEIQLINWNRDGR